MRQSVANSHKENSLHTVIKFNLVQSENGGDKLVHGSGGISQLRAE